MAKRQRVPLLIAPGIFSDETTFAARGTWADGNNMRPHRGSMQTVGGWAMAIDGIGGIARNVFAWTENDGTPDIAFGTHTGLHVHTGGALYDITPTSGFTAGAEHGAGGPGYGAGAWDEGTYGSPSIEDYFPLTWSLDKWGENLLASPRMQSLFLWENDTATEATQVANAPDNIASMLVTAQRQVLAFGCNEEASGDFNPLIIRGSDIDDYTDWTSRPSNNAFEFPALEGSGRIVGARRIGPYIGVWTDNAVYLGEFLGDPVAPYRFDRVAGNCGLIGPNAVCLLGEMAYWISPDYQFWMWQPGALPHMVGCPIRNDFRDNVAQNQFEKIAAVPVGQFGEVWWFYPDARDGLECSRYIALSVTESAWFKGIMDRSCGCDTGPTQYPLMVTPEGTAYWHENGQSADGGALVWSLSTADQYFDEAGTEMFVSGFWPDFEGQQGAVSMTLRFRRWPQDAVERTRGPYSLGVLRRKQDFTMTGRVAAADFSGNSAPAFVRFGRPSYDARPAGKF